MALEIERLAPSVWRVPLATPTLPPFDHVNSYLIASNGVAALVDPGSDAPESQAALDSLMRQEGVRLLKMVLLTHTHPDHVDGLAALAEKHPGTPVYVHGAEAGQLDASVPTVVLGDGRRLAIGNVVVEAMHTPGHSPGHLSFLVEGVAIVGDLVAGVGSSWVGVPGGDVTAYLSSLERLAARRPDVLGPGHGPAIYHALAKLKEAHDHRVARERQVLQALDGEPRSLSELRVRIYPELDPAVHDLAERSLLAHLLKLMQDMKVLHLGEDERGPYTLRR